MKRVTTENIDDLIPGDTVSFDVVRRITGCDAEIKDKYLQADRSAGKLGKEELYQTFIRFGSDQPFYYAGLCKLCESKNISPATSKCVFIISAHHSMLTWKREFNASFNRAIARREFLRGRIPIMPHIYFTQFMDDDDQMEREWGMEIGHIIMENYCDEVAAYVVDGIISDSMKRDIEFASSIGHEVKFEYLTMNEARELIETITEETL